MMSNAHSKEQLKEAFDIAMEEATKIFGADPAYYGEEGDEEVERQLNKLGYSVEDFKKERKVDVSEECMAVCSKCNQSTSGKIYDPYQCTDCKIKELEQDVEHYKELYRITENEKFEWIKKYNEESIQKTKFRHAFECLYEKVESKE